MTPFELVCSRLRVVRRSGSTATAHCPGPQHSRGDRHPSLSVTVGADGKVLLKCHAGCSTEAIVAEIGLPRGMADLFPDDGRRDSFRSGNGGSALPPHPLRDRQAARMAPPPPPAAPAPAAEEWTESRMPTAAELRRGGRAPSNVWPDRDREGRIVAFHVRFDQPDGKKDMPWWRDGAWGLGGRSTEDLPLYGSEQVNDYDRAQPLFLFEGEKCTDAAAGVGLQALGTVTGAGGTPGRAPLEVLDGFQVALCPDLDDHRGGEQHMGRCGLRAVPVAASLRLLLVAKPGSRPSGYDIADWIEEQREEGKDDDAIRETLLAMARAAPELFPGELAGLEKRAEAEPPPAAPAGPNAAVVIETGDGQPSGGGELAIASQEIAAPRGRAIEVTPTAETIDFEPYHERPWPQLDPRAFHGLAGRAVRLIGPQSEADPAAILVQFMVATGNVVGRTAYYRVGGARHYTNLYAVLVGGTSKARKGTAWHDVRWLIEGANPEWAKRRVKPGLSSGEGLIHEVRDMVPAHLGANGKQVGADPGAEDKRFLAIEEEFGKVLAVMARPGNTLSGVLRSLWDSGNASTLTKVSPSIATEAHFSFVAHITEEELRRDMDRTTLANGLANRMLFTMARRSQELPFGGRIDQAAMAALAGKVIEVADFARKNPERSEMDAEASAAWADAYHELSAGRPGLLGALIGRAEAHVCRLAMLYALLDCSLTIRLCHLEAAMALWAYCRESVHYVFGDALGDPEADTIFDGLRRSPRGLTLTEIRDLFQRHATTHQINRAIQVLQRTGIAVVISRPTKGRPETRLQLAAPAAPLALPPAGNGGGAPEPPRQPAHPDVAERAAAPGKAPNLGPSPGPASGHRDCDKSDESDKSPPRPPAAATFGR